MRYAEIINEDVNLDVEMNGVARKAANAITNHVYNTKKPDAVLGFEGADAYAIFPETLGFDKKFGLGDLLLMVTMQKPGKGTTAAYIPLGGITYKHYKQAIIVYCMKEISEEGFVHGVVNTKFLEVFEHEFVHCIDEIRTQGRIFKGPYNPKDPTSYYNHPGEFNAYFHNLASEMLSFIADTKNASPEEIADHADLYGIYPDFKRTIMGMMNKNWDIQLFVKWLRDDRRKSLLKRLYKLHQACAQIAFGQQQPQQRAA